MEPKPKITRSRLPKSEARAHYLAIGEMAVLEQIRADADMLETDAIAIGPFARIDATAVAAREGKTRGAVTNLFGSQAAFQVETMLMALDVEDDLAFPDPAEFADAEAWLDAFLVLQSARGPQHGAEPEVSYAFLWTLWLTTMPYGIWSERVAGPGMDEYARTVRQIEDALTGVIRHFGLGLRDGTTAGELATAIASLTEGTWLNQCLTRAHPTEPGSTMDAALRTSGRLLWRGAVEKP